MTIDERLHIIGEFIRRSDEEFDDGGNNLIAAELLWGAVAHGLIAIAEINGWRCEGHRGYQAVSVQLDEHSPPGPCDQIPQPPSNFTSTSTEATWARENFAVAAQPPSAPSTGCSR